MAAVTSALQMRRRPHQLARSAREIGREIGGIVSLWRPEGEKGFVKGDAHGQAVGGGRCSSDIGPVPENCCRGSIHIATAARSLPSLPCLQAEVCFPRGPQ